MIRFLFFFSIISCISQGRKTSLKNTQIAKLGHSSYINGFIRQINIPRDKGSSAFFCYSGANQAIKMAYELGKKNAEISMKLKLDNYLKNNQSDKIIKVPSTTEISKLEKRLKRDGISAINYCIQEKK